MVRQIGKKNAAYVDLFDNWRFQTSTRTGNYIKFQPLRLIVPKWARNVKGISLEASNMNQNFLSDSLQLMHVTYENLNSINMQPSMLFDSP